VRAKRGVKRRRCVAAGWAKIQFSIPFPPTHALWTPRSLYSTRGPHCKGAWLQYDWGCTDGTRWRRDGDKGSKIMMDGPVESRWVGAESSARTHPIGYLAFTTDAPGSDSTQPAQTLAEHSCVRSKPISIIFSNSALSRKSRKVAESTDLAEQNFTISLLLDQVTRSNGFATVSNDPTPRTPRHHIMGFTKTRVCDRVIIILIASCCDWSPIA